MTKTTQRAPAASAGAVPDDLTARLRTIRDALLTGLVERDVAIRLALIATLAGEHLLLIGPPGTAKSLIARRLHLAFADATYFERLLTRFTVPEELFGPLSIKGLEEDRYERLTHAYLPQASIAFLDEIFKANSAILNALLTLLNEREFDNGVNRDATPLIAVVGASNELPSGEELDALFDRFLLRLHVGPVSSQGFPTLLGLRGESQAEIADDLRLTPEVLAQVQASAQDVAVPPDVVALLCDLRELCIAEQIPVSDRRWRKVVKLLQVAALTNGRDTVSIWDCWLLQHCLWAEPEQRKVVYDWYASRVGASSAMDPSSLTKIVLYQEAQLQIDRNSRSQRRDESGRRLFLDEDGNATAHTGGRRQVMREDEKLFLAPARSWRQRYENRAITDRTNDGEGWTEEELDSLYIASDERFEYWDNRAAYLAEPSNWMTEEVDYTPIIEPTPQKRQYIEAMLREVDQLRDDVNAYIDKIVAHIAAMESDITSHLWVTQDFVVPAKTSLEKTHSQVNTLLARIRNLRQGIELLPVEGDHAKTATELVANAQTDED